jgi:hypothetical protein
MVITRVTLAIVAAASTIWFHAIRRWHHHDDFHARHAARWHFISTDDGYALPPGT